VLLTVEAGFGPKLSIEIPTHLFYPTTLIFVEVEVMVLTEIAVLNSVDVEIAVV
jgi:hypothetical protein